MFGPSEPEAPRLLKICLLFLSQTGKASSGAHVRGAALRHHGCGAGQRRGVGKVPAQIHQVGVPVGLPSM